MAADMSPGLMPFVVLLPLTARRKDQLLFDNHLSTEGGCQEDTMLSTLAYSSFLIERSTNPKKATARHQRTRFQ